MKRENIHTHDTRGNRTGIPQGASASSLLTHTTRATVSACHLPSAVGSNISVSHLRPTTPRAQVSATATPLERDGRKLTFRVEAADDKGKIGEGEHVRYIIDK